VHRRLPSSGVAVVPFGGGTSVVGGVTPSWLLRCGDRLDLSRLNACSRSPRTTSRCLEPADRTEAEALLNARGFTLGHFPQSFEHATIRRLRRTRWPAGLDGLRALPTRSSSP